MRWTRYLGATWRKRHRVALVLLRSWRPYSGWMHLVWILCMCVCHYSRPRRGRFLAILPLPLSPQNLRPHHCHPLDSDHSCIRGIDSSNQFSLGPCHTRHHQQPRQLPWTKSECDKRDTNFAAAKHTQNVVQVVSKTVTNMIFIYSQE